MILEILLGLIIPSLLQERAEVEPQQSPSAMERTSAQQVEPDRNTLMKAYRNLEFADTPQEREQIHASLIPSTERKMSPEVFSSFAERFDLGRQGAPDTQKITMSDDTFNSFAQRYGFAAAAPPMLTQQPAPRAVSEIAMPVFEDEAAFKKTVEGAPASVQPFAEVTADKSFGDTFKAARAEGKDTFLYDKGKGLEKFTTLLEGEPAKAAQPKVLIDREKVRSQLRAGAYKQSLLPVKDEVTAEVQGFTKYAEQHGVQPAAGKDIDLSQISEEMGPALDVVAPIFKEVGITPELTSGARNAGDWSLHEVGEAVDLRLKTASAESIKKLKAALPGKPRSTSIHGEKGSMWSDGTYEYIIHGSGDNAHLHIERETEDAKGRLVKHMIDQGHSDKISKKGLARYPDLLKKYADLL